jgi:Htaa protein
VAMVAAAMTAAASLAVVALPAAAAPVSITNATFDWAVHDTIQFVAGPCHYLSAGVTTTNVQADYHTQADDVSILKDGVTPTWAGRCTPAGGTGTSLNQKVHWTGGTGTVDPSTGASTIQFTGSLSMVMNGTLAPTPSPIVISDPLITVAADGTGTMTATVDAYATTGDHTPVANVVVANLGGVGSANTTGFTTTPLFQSVTYTPPAGGTAQNTTGTGGVWGAWPTSWINAVWGSGNGAFYYTTSTAATQPRKAPSPLVVDYGLTTSNDSMTIGVTVPVVAEPGEFVWEITGDGQVSMSEGVNHADHWGYTGAIQPITVTDNRDGAPAWSISGQVSDFNGGIDGKYLGWKPKVTTAGSGATPGAQVASGFISGNGLKTSSVLASGAAAHAAGAATVGADLDLRLPISTPAGSYSATLTITALS